MLIQLKLTALLSTRLVATIIKHKAEMLVIKTNHEIIMVEVRRLEALAQ